jgi:hypothetical protein
MPPAPRPRRKSGCGCLWGCLGLVVIVVLLAGGVLLLPKVFPPRSDNLALGKRESLASQTIPASGGAIVVDLPGNPIDGLTITVPEGAYDGQKRFKVSSRPIESHTFGATFDPITPLIHVDNGDAFAAEPLVVEIPIQIAPDEFAMAFYYDVQTGELEGIPVADLTTDKITIVTSHFSDFAITKIPLYLLENISVDTGFLPGVDDWPFTNNGSYLAPGGHCAGQAISAMWYYYEKRLRASEAPLYGRYDDNDYPLSTLYFGEDDSWSYRFASVVHDSLIDWDHSSRVFFKAMGRTSDQLTWAAFAYALLQTGEPQYVAIYTQDSGHAIIAYKMEQGQLYVADPNYPGVEGRTIRFENGQFQPYYSGDNATAITENGETAYTDIRYMAKSAMTNWTDIGVEYERMQKGESGDPIWPAYTLEYLSGVNETTGEEIWTPAPETLELTEEDTAKPGEPYRGQVVFRLTPLAGLGDIAGSLYDGTNLLISMKSSGARHDVKFTYPLDPGIHHIGFQFDDYEPVTANSYRLNYIDFRRVKVIYEPEDLTGKWEGAWQVTSANKVKQVIEDLLVQFLVALGVDEQKAREAVAASLQDDPNLYADHPLIITFEKIAPDVKDRYRMYVLMTGDPGVVTEYEGEAIYREGVLTFDVSSSGSRFEFTGSLTDDDVLSGDFSLTAWGIVKDAVLGNWLISR